MDTMFAESVSYSAALLAGLLSFFSPCILPLIPAYFTFITGFSLEELTKSGGKDVRRVLEKLAKSGNDDARRYLEELVKSDIDDARKYLEELAKKGNDGARRVLEELAKSGNENIRKKVVLSTIAYVCGFSLVFILLGASASFLGSFMEKYSTYVRVGGGVLIIVLGIHLTGVIRFGQLDVERRMHLRKKPLHFFGTFLVGMAFAAGWSPCIGPLLGSILIIAGSQDTVMEGVLLLATYSAGMALPFVLMSVFIHLILNFIKKANKALKYLTPAAGILLIVVGLALITDKLHLFTNLG